MMNDHTHVLEIPVERANGQGKMYWGSTEISFSELMNSRSDYLHLEEEKIFAQYKNEVKQEHFLRGRYIAKKTLCNHLSCNTPCQIQVLPGVFHQPIVCLLQGNPPAVSISHSSSQAHCISYPREHPMGIDIELIQSDNGQNIRSQTTSAEQKLFELCESEALFYTRLWTIKESLSKVLHTGLFAPFDVYEVAQITHYEGYVESVFTHFYQYKTLSFIQGNYVLSLTLPRNTYFNPNLIIHQSLAQYNY